MKEQIFIGAVVTVLCGLGLWRDHWLLAQTRHGRRLVDLLGEPTALWVLRVCLIAGAIFGALLASNIIRPVEW